MSKTARDLENELSELLWDNECPLSFQEVVKVHKISYELGRASVYNENGWEYDCDE